METNFSLLTSTLFVDNVLQFKNRSQQKIFLIIQIFLNVLNFLWFFFLLYLYICMLNKGRAYLCIYLFHCNWFRNCLIHAWLITNSQHFYFNLYPQWDTAVEYEIFIDKLIVQKATRWGIVCVSHLYIHYLVSVSHV